MMNGETEGWNMNISIQSMEEKYLEPSLDLIQRVFTEHENAEEGKLVRRLTQEIRSKRFHMPQLEIIAVDEAGEVVGYAGFSRFHLEGKYEDKLLLLTPVAVKTELQRQHISKRMIEYGFEKAKEMGFEAAIVEGNPRNYNARGFVTAADHGIMPGKTVHLPRIECLMVKELKAGALENIKGMVEYSDYESLTGE
jgi:predicted N-acetyltransferase YhbS